MKGAAVGGGRGSRWGVGGQNMETHMDVACCFRGR